MRYCLIALKVCLILLLFDFITPGDPLDDLQSTVSSGDMDTKTGFIELKDGGRLYYEAAGEGDDIILIHDGLVHSQIWDAQFKEFSKNYKVVRYDRRGYGKSPPPEKAYSIVEDLNELFASLKIGHAVVMGMSMGGGLAIDFTLAYPQKVDALVLVGSVVNGFGYSAHMRTRGGHLTAEIYGDQALFRKYWYEDDPYEISPANSAAKEKVKKWMTANPQNYDNDKHNLNRGAPRKAIDYLHEINVPVLILVGEEDIPDVHAHAGAINAGIKNSKRIIVNQAGHLIPLEQPEEFNRQVWMFLNSMDFYSILETKGAAEAAAYFYELRKNKPDVILFTEPEMNSLGYRYLQTDKTGEAIELFKLNTATYPDSFNVYDSLAEAYMAAGEKDLAIKNYKKSLALNPANTNAVEKLAELEKSD